MHPNTCRWVRVLDVRYRGISVGLFIISAHREGEVATIRCDDFQSFEFVSLNNDTQHAVELVNTSI